MALECGHHRLWRAVMIRRSQRARKKWEKFAPLFNRRFHQPFAVSSDRSGQQQVSHIDATHNQETGHGSQ